MKITPADYQALRDVVIPVLVDADVRYGDTLAAYMARDPRIPRIDKAGDPAKRYRWDVLHAAGQQARDLLRDARLYGYLNDDHIDTALRAIVADYQAARRAAKDQTS